MAMYAYEDMVFQQGGKNGPVDRCQMSGDWASIVGASDERLPFI
jgi:hypothetical protein